MPQGAFLSPIHLYMYPRRQKGSIIFQKSKYFIYQRMENKKMKCCICGKSFYGNGNNAYPLIRSRANKCCNECNNDYIIPLRMIEILAKKEREKTEVPN